MKLAKLKMLLALFGLLVIFTSCAPTALYIPNTLPSTMQQDIKTAESNDIAFEFIPHQKGNLINVKVGPMWDVSYSVNQPFQGLLNELLQSKFSEIKVDSKNKLKVEITELESTVQIGTMGIREAYTLKMAVKVEIQKGDESINKRFSYTFNMPIRSGFENANAVFKKEVADGVKELLIKFSISIDKFIDANKL